MASPIFFVLVAAFLASFWWQARREGLTFREWGRRRYAAPRPRGWWVPLAIYPSLVVLVLAISASRDGFEPGSLIALPLLLIWLAIIVALVRSRR